MTPISKYEDLSAEELMKLYQVEDDLDALSELTILLLPQLVAIARKRFSDKNLVDEAVQEAWMKVIKSAKSFQHGSKVKTWAYQIVNNTYLDLIRRESTRGYLSDDLEILDNRADHSEEFAENLANEITIKSALLKIPRDQAEAVQLVWLDQCSVEEAAKILGVPAGTVKSRISRGKSALAEILNDLDPRVGNQKHA
jgi:RNA polymerase sigma-70 factor (ECF subfamily)